MPDNGKSDLCLSHNVHPIGLSHTDRSWRTGLSISTCWSISLMTLKWPEGKGKVLYLRYTGVWRTALLDFISII